MIMHTYRVLNESTSKATHILREAEQRAFFFFHIESYRGFSDKKNAQW